MIQAACGLLRTVLRLVFLAAWLVSQRNCAEFDLAESAGGTRSLAEELLLWLERYMLRVFPTATLLHMP